MQVTYNFSLLKINIQIECNSINDQTSPSEPMLINLFHASWLNYCKQVGLFSLLVILVLLHFSKNFALAVLNLLTMVCVAIKKTFLKKLPCLEFIQ